MDRTGCGLHALLTQQSQTSFIKIKRMEIYWVLSHNNGHITWCFMKTNSRCKNIFNNVTKKPGPPERPLTSLATNKDKLQQAINQEPIISCLWRVHKKFLRGQATIKKGAAIDTRNPPQHQPDPPWEGARGVTLVQIITTPHHQLLDTQLPSLGKFGFVSENFSAVILDIITQFKSNCWLKKIDRVTKDSKSYNKKYC